MQTFPKSSDIGNAVKMLKISVELPAIPDTSIMSHSIIEGVKDGKLKATVKMIQDQANDNYTLMESIVGYDLLKTIMDINL